MGRKAEVQRMMLEKLMGPEGKCFELADLPPPCLVTFENPTY